MLVAVALTGCSGQKSASGGTGTEAVPGPETSLPSENMELVQPEVEFASYFIRLFTKNSGPPFGGPFHGRGNKAEIWELLYWMDTQFVGYFCGRLRF